MATQTKRIAPGTDENSVNLDFRGVGPRSGGPVAHAPEGDYLLEVVSAKNVPVANGPNKGKRQIAWVIRIAAPGPDLANDPEARSSIGDSIYLNTSAEPDSKGRWFLRNLLEDMLGVDVTEKVLSPLRLDDKVGKRFGGTLVDGDPYTDKEGNEKVRSEIKYTFPAARITGATAAPTAAKTAGEGSGSAPAAKAQPAAEEVSTEVTTTDDNEDIDELDVQSL